MWFNQKKKEREALEQLHQMSRSTWKCKSCNDDHNGLMDLAMASPSVWNHEEIIEPNSALRLDGNFLSEDFCVMDGKSFIVRCVLDIPVKGLHENFGFGVWSSLSKDNFLKYVEEFDEGIEDQDIHWTSWFCSQLSYFGETLSEKAWVSPRPNRQRPHVTLMTKGSSLGQAQINGITAVELLKIFEFYGNHVPSKT